MESRLRDKDKSLVRIRHQLLSELSLLQREEVVIEEAIRLSSQPSSSISTSTPSLFRS